MSYQKSKTRFTSNCTYCTVVIATPSRFRELPVSLLGDDKTYTRWIRASQITDLDKRIAEIKSILSPAGQELSAAAARNVQYLTKFLVELSTKCEQTKMTQRNIAIVLAPTLLRPSDKKGPLPEHSENIIGIVDTLIKNYQKIFPVDIDLTLEDEDVGEMKLPGNGGDASPMTAPIRHRFRRSRSKSPASTVVPSTTSAFVSAVAAGSGSGMHSSPIYSPPPAVSPPSSATPPTTLHSLSIESPSPKHKRKPSVRAIGKNFMDKIKVQASGGGSSSSRGSSADGIHIQPDHNSV